MNWSNFRFLIVALLVIVCVGWAVAQQPGGPPAVANVVSGVRINAPVRGRAIYREPFAMVGTAAREFIQVEQTGSMIDVDGTPLNITGSGRWQFHGANWAVPSALVRVSRNAAGASINHSLIDRSDFTGFSSMAHVINDGAEISTIRMSGFVQMQPDGACLVYTNQDRPQLNDYSDRRFATNSGHTIDSCSLSVGGECRATGPNRGACIRLRGEVTDMAIRDTWFGGNAPAIVLVDLPDESGPGWGRNNTPKRIRLDNCYPESEASKLIVCYGVSASEIELVGSSKNSFRVVDGAALDNPGGGNSDGPGPGGTDDPPRPPSGWPAGIPAPEWGLGVRTDAPATRTFSGGAFPYLANAGDVIEIAAGNYPASIDRGYLELTARGTAERPIIIRGVGKPRIGQKLYLKNCDYVYITGFDFHGVVVTEGSDHWVIADSRVGSGGRLELVNGANAFPVRHGGGMAVSAPDSNPVSHGLIIRCQMVDNGDFALGESAETHGLTINGAVSYVSVVDCELARNSGDGAQINGDRMDYSGPEPQCRLNHIYFGRVNSHENRQVGFATKQCADVIFFGCLSYGHAPYGFSPSAWGAGFGHQYGGARIWNINCESRDNISGASGGSSNGPGGAWYFINFYAHDNTRANDRRPPEQKANSGLQAPGDSWGPAGLALAGSPDVTVIGATLRNNDAGLNFPGGQRIAVLGSIIEGLRQPEGNAAFIYDTQYLRELAFVGNAIAPGSERFARGQQRSLLSPWLAAFGTVARASGNVIATGGTWTPSDADKAAFAEFKRRYGIDIDVDFSGKPRPSGARKIGAHEP